MRQGLLELGIVEQPDNGSRNRHRDRVAGFDDLRRSTIRRCIARRGAGVAGLVCRVELAATARQRKVHLRMRGKDRALIFRHKSLHATHILDRRRDHEIDTGRKIVIGRFLLHQYRLKTRIGKTPRNKFTNLVRSVRQVKPRSHVSSAIEHGAYIGVARDHRRNHRDFRREKHPCRMARVMNLQQLSVLASGEEQ
jgi:hypothetical protein